MNVGEKQKFRVGIFLGNLGLEFFEYIQIGKISLGFVQILCVVATPMERLSRSPLDSAGVDTAFLQYVFMLGREVIAYNCDDSHLGKKAGRQGEMCARSTQNILYASGRRGDVIECHRTND